MTSRRFARAAVAVSVLALAAMGTAAEARTFTVREYKLSGARVHKLQTRFIEQIQARYPQGSWAPMRYELRNKDLRLMGLPSKRVLLSHRYRRPTAAYPSGKLVRLGMAAGGNGKGGGGSSGGSSGGSTSSSPGVVTFAGTGFFGIRPGAWLLFFGQNEIWLCSAAHVYGTPGAYSISTAGHCGDVGQVATVIGLVGNHTPVLIDFGKVSQSTGDGGLGRDWALISVFSQYQGLVTPTMAFWGGPIGMYTATGDVVSFSWGGRGPSFGVNPNPTLVQQIVHYGHGLGVGTGGTPRSGTAITWRTNYYMFFGAINFGDSGSGSNTLSGDTVGANREAAGINTHLWVDPLMRQGVGIMAGTRATQVNGTLANGQILPYPAPTPIPLP